MKNPLAFQDVALAEAVKENSLALLDGWNLKRKPVTWKIPGKSDIADNIGCNHPISFGSSACDVPKMIREK